jgi:hypothetical protein
VGAPSTVGPAVDNPCEALPPRAFQKGASRRDPWKSDVCEDTTLAEGGGMRVKTILNGIEKHAGFVYTEAR